VSRCSKRTGYSISRKAQQEVKPRSERTLTVHLWTFIANSLLGLLLRHIGKFNKLTSVCERNPGISHARIIFALLRVVCFLCKHRTLSGRFPCRVAFGSHLIAFPCGAPRTLSMLTIVAAKARLTFCCWNQFIASRFFIVVQLYPICERGVRSKWCCTTHMPLPKPAQFFAALIFVSLVSLAMHFLAAPRVTTQTADATAVKSWRRDPGKAEQSKAGE